MAYERLMLDETVVGNHITDIWDDIVVNNSKWSVYDASAGTNQKVYRCNDSDNNSDFYVNVINNQTLYSTIELWEGWNASTHVGEKRSLTAMPTNTFRVYAARMVHVVYNDHRVIICTSYGSQQCYIGQLKRADVSRNMPVIIAKSSASTYWHNPLGLYHATTSTMWGILINHMGAPGAAINPVFEADSDNYIKTLNGGYNLNETAIVGDNHKLIYGWLDGAINLYNSENYLWDGQIIHAEDGPWLHMEGAYSTKYHGLVRLT